MIGCAIHRLLTQSKKGSNNLESIELILSEKIEEIKDDWDKLEIKDVFMQSPYLSVAENYGNPDVKPYYVILKSDKNVLSGFLFQLTPFDFNTRLSSDVNSSGIVQKFLNKKMVYNVLIHGNLYLSGKHMNYFEDHTLSEELKTEYILDVLDELQDYLLDEGKKVDAVLIKDKDQGKIGNSSLKDESSFSHFCVDPNMVIDMNPSWRNMDDYLTDIKSKYKVRYRKARKLKEGLELKQLELADLDTYKDIIYALYVKTATSAGFNMGFFDADYFYQLKKNLADDCEIYGYFYQNEMIGFYSTISNHGIFHAHFLGIDTAYNKTHKLYTNILYDILSYTIDNKSKELFFSRTALEIKSTLGAIAKELHCYVKLNSRIRNKLVPYILPKIISNPDWIQRSPFKN